MLDPTRSAQTRAVHRRGHGALSCDQRLNRHAAPRRARPPLAARQHPVGRARAPAADRCGGGFRPNEIYVGYATSTFKKVTAFYAAARAAHAPRRRFVSLRPRATIAAIVDAERPDILVGYGGWIDLFFRTVAARGIALHPPKLVMYMAEALPPGGRAHIEDTFGIPVMSRYNAVESFKIGFYCEHRTGFHVHEDLCHVRILGDDGRDLGAGSRAES